MTNPPNTPQHYGPDGRPSPDWTHPYPPARAAAPDPTEPPRGGKTRRQVTLPLLLVILAALAIAVVSCGVGSASAGGAATVTATETATLPAPPPATVTTTTAASAEVPKACLEALESADRGFELAGKGFQATADVMGDAEAAFKAIAAGDLAALEEASGKLGSHGKQFRRIVDKISPVLDRYRAQRDECRAS